MTGTRRQLENSQKGSTGEDFNRPRTLSHNRPVHRVHPETAVEAPDTGPKIDSAGNEIFT